MTLLRPVCHRCHKKRIGSDAEREHIWCRDCVKQYTRDRRAQNKDTWLIKRRAESLAKKESAVPMCPCCRQEIK
jgi:hypothetical protein